jgi:hypothetical protein
MTGKKGMCRGEVRYQSYESNKTIRQHPFLLGYSSLSECSSVRVLTSWGPTAPSGPMGYRDLSNEDLSEKGVTMARALRALAREMMATDEKLRSRCDRENDLAKTEQAKSTPAIVQ